MTGHLGAILLAFNRQNFGSFLDDALAGLGQATAAVLIAGTVLEYFERSPSAGALPPEQRRQIAEWRQLRNQVAHGSATALTVQQARHLIEGVREILTATRALGEPGGGLRPEAVAPRTVKGRYSRVPTSSDDFIRRKREELDLEDRG